MTQNPVTELPTVTGDFAWEVTTEDTGETFTVHMKPASRMPWGIVEDVTENPELGIKLPLGWAMSDDERAILRRVPQTDVIAMMNAWQEAGGVTVGESSGLSGSPATNRNARRSKRT